MLARGFVVHVLVWALLAPSMRASVEDALILADDFEHGLAHWEITGVDAVAIRESGDPSHGHVLELTPNGDVLALLRGSDRWGPVRLEGEMRFPTGTDNYLGFAYNHVRRGARRDFGLIYVKGNESYLQVNPHRDFNVSRLVYPEMHVALEGDAKVETGVWQRFRLEVHGSSAHLYVGPGAVPQVTFDGFEHARGAIGLQPRSVGGAVWVDNIRVSRLPRLSYAGPPLPSYAYDRAGLTTAWQVAGPFRRTDDLIALKPEAHRGWRTFDTDARGAVITNRIVDSHGEHTVAYFRTRFDSTSGGEGELQISTADDLALWVNGRFVSFVPRQSAAWFDFPHNPRHAGHRVPITLRAGVNDVVVRVRGGVYASGGFYARVVSAPN